MIIGIDPSIANTGLCGIAPPYYDNDHDLEVMGRAGVAKMDHWAALQSVLSLAEAIERWTPFGRVRCAAIEAPYASTGRGAAAGLPGERTHLFYLLLDYFDRLHVPTVVVPNAKLKRYATGKGNANKAAMLEALVRRAPEFETRGNDNLVDAAWLAMLAADMIGTPVVTVPASHREALKGLEIHK